MQRRAITSPREPHTTKKESTIRGPLLSSSSVLSTQSSPLRLCLLLSPLLATALIWIFATGYFLFTTNTSAPLSPSHFLRLPLKKNDHGESKLDAREDTEKIYLPNDEDTPKLIPHQAQKAPTILSRLPQVQITSSVRGNLGPPSVINQDPPGQDWIKDRWQAASDMGGTAIPGSHWLLLDFSHLAQQDSVISVTKILLDWETAYADNYRIEGRISPPYEPSSGNTEAWCLLYDGENNVSGKDLDTFNALESPSRPAHRTVKEYGQSPGVKMKMPLHIVHTIDFSQDNVVAQNMDVHSHDCRNLKFLRIFIRKPARSWGVSLWQVDVYGRIQ